MWVRFPPGVQHSRKTKLVASLCLISRSRLGSIPTTTTKQKERLHMTANQKLNTCHKVRIENCKGELLEPRENYGKWAYWCGNKKVRGWSSISCNCKKMSADNLKEPDADYLYKKVKIIKHIEDEGYISPRPYVKQLIGEVGVIVDYSNSHGLCFGVVFHAPGHPDSLEILWFEPEEVKFL